MNHLATLVYNVPGKPTNQVIKELAQACNQTEAAIRQTMSRPEKDMYASTAIKAVRYFNLYYPCSIEDLIETNLDKLAKKRGLVPANNQSINRRGKSRGARATVHQ